MEDRSNEEITICRYAVFVLQVVRVLILSYFIVQTTRWMKYKNDNKIDSNTILTFLFLGLMFFS
jgi:hypothetical protein